MKWEPKIHTDNCNKWLNHLKSHKLISISDNVGHLVPPFSISISNKIYKDIVKMYIPHEEKGGLFFASLSKKGNHVILEIESLFEVKNNVEKEFPGSSKSNSYFPERKKYLKILSENFSSDDSSRIKLPIHFHTHPTSDKYEDIKYYTQLIHPLNTSEQDIKVSKTRHIQLNNFSMFYLNAIITGDESEHRIMFYGNNVTPDNYAGVKSIQLFETVRDVTEEIESEGWKMFTRIALGGLGLVAIIRVPYMIQPFLDNFVYALDRKEYWGKLEKDNTTTIKISFSEIQL